MRKYYFLLILLITSCRAPYGISLSNQTGSNIILKITDIDSKERTDTINVCENLLLAGKSDLYFGFLKIDSTPITPHFKQVIIYTLKDTIVLNNLDDLLVLVEKTKENKSKDDCRAYNWGTIIILK